MQAKKKIRGHPTNMKLKVSEQVTWYESFGTSRWFAVIVAGDI